MVKGLFFAAATCAAALVSSLPSAEAFAPPASAFVHRQISNPHQVATPTSLKMFDPSAASDLSSNFASAATSASTFLATIDSDIANIPDDQFGKVFAGGGLIIFGSILSVVIVGFLVEYGGGYADIVAETYAEQNYAEEGETFLDSLNLSSGEKKDTEEMILKFREKKKKKAGTWTDADEKVKQEKQEERDMFDDYDE